MTVEEQDLKVEATLVKSTLRYVYAEKYRFCRTDDDAILSSSGSS